MLKESKRETLEIPWLGELGPGGEECTWYEFLLSVKFGSRTDHRVSSRDSLELYCSLNPSLPHKPKRKAQSRYLWLGV